MGILCLSVTVGNAHGCIFSDLYYVWPILNLVLSLFWLTRFGAYRKIAKQKTNQSGFFLARAPLTSLTVGDQTASLVSTNTTQPVQPLAE